MIRMQIDGRNYTVETAGDVLDLIRQYISPTTLLTIDTVEDTEGTVIVISGAGAKPTTGTWRKK